MKPTTGQPKSAILEERSEAAFESLKNCSLCPRKCGVNRLRGQKGFCRAGLNPVVYSYFAHFGEEPPISGTRGSGAIFFTHCTMHCVYCQNHVFSQQSDEKETSAESLAGIMLELKDKGCHNINLVTPAHFVPQILKALYLAGRKGMDLPIVYNTSGYDTVETLGFLDGIVDVYLPDMRYGNDENAIRFSNAPGYFNTCKKALKEMFRQAGNLVLDADGIAKKGLVIRHLVLPNGVAATDEIFKFISGHISKKVYISLMSQYYPAYNAKDFPQINRRITQGEYEEATGLFLKYGLVNGWVQDPSEEMDLKLLGTNIKKI
ncbi:MAG: radical SAM protein [Candidatus Omnitrophica bacterium]|nr:radical SAM protein [Candidatus Omnitrophota bacterium]